MSDNSYDPADSDTRDRLERTMIAAIDAAVLSLALSRHWSRDDTPTKQLTLKGWQQALGDIGDAMEKYQRRSDSLADLLEPIERTVAHLEGKGRQCQ